MQTKENEIYLYPKIEPKKTHYVQTESQHTLYVEQSGNLDGIPIIFLHGGPGGKVHPSDRRYFNPEKYHIILFDQRGCGRSSPFANTEENTSHHLVEDIELIRKFLSIDAFVLFGGSWGSTLALLYLIKYPTKVLSLILRGIFLGSQEELDWFYEGHGAHAIYPEAYEKFLSPLNHIEKGHVIEAYSTIVSDPSHPSYYSAINEWSTWEGRTLSLESKSEIQDAFLEEKMKESIAKIECHFFKNKLFVENEYIIKNISQMKSLPSLEIVHGRYDVICPLLSAWKLNKAYPESKLHICEASGHTASEIRITKQLVTLTDKLEL